MKQPGLAQAFLNMNTTVTPDNAEKFSFLKDDPDFAEVWEDIKTNGPSALQKVRDAMSCPGERHPLQYTISLSMTPPRLT